MVKRSQKSTTDFLSGFSLKKDILVRPNKKSGQPGLREGTDSVGRRIFLKYWPRERGIDDQDLEDIWRGEIRQLHRLAALPHADDLIVRMIANGKDDTGFYLVLDAGELLPFQALKDRGASIVLQNIRQPHTRLLLWTNFRRLVRGVDLLHSQAVIHRNIDPWCILTNLRSVPDFRLTGFEWSMRITTAALDGKRVTPKALRRRPATSFAADWADLALVMTEILEIPADRLVNMQIVPSAVVDHSSAAEVRLLRTMLGLLPVERLDAEEIFRHLAGVVATLRDDVLTREPRYFAALNLGETSKLTRRIRESLNYEIDVNDLVEQMEFILNDLGPTPQFIAYNTEIGGELIYCVCGDRLNYKIRPYKRPGSTEPESWEFAFVDDADSLPPLPMAIKSSIPVETASFEFLPVRDAYQEFPKLRGKTLSWELLIKQSEKTSKQKSATQQLHHALSVLLRLEMAFAAADIYPIRVLTRPDMASVGDRYRIEVADEVDSDRLALAEALKIAAPAVRLQKLLSRDEPNEELKQKAEWALLDSGALGTRGTVSKWRIETPPSPETDGVFTLEGSQPPQLAGRAFLTPADSTGTLAQLKRRQRALSTLASHTELLQLLVDQRGPITDSQDSLDTTDRQFEAFDDSKKAALVEITSTIPFFMLQGPPGVGKTHLVTDIVRRKLSDEPTSRLLLSAQSNAAIDHLMGKVNELYENKPDQPVMIRARSADDERDSGDLEIDVQATRLLGALAGSELCVKKSPLSERIRAMVNVASGSTGATRSLSASDRRAFESLLLRSANVVFATTNSPALETLIDERGFFDWTIVEEAAKATGTDLIQPLLLSYRRLMIGDHKQLPPFDLDKMTALLADPPAVHRAISASQKLIARYLKDAAIDEALEDAEASQENFAKTCGDALELLTMFATFIEREYGRIARRPYQRRIARRLDEQHRMHPAIARIVSTSFYENELRTFKKKEEEFLNTPAPVTFKNEVGIPNVPVTFIDMPFSRTAPPGTHFGDSVEPFRVNHSEAQVSRMVLRALSVTPGLLKKPTLAILSPYMEQVKLLRSTLGSSVINWLSNEFSPEDGGEFFGTVDSFQGREADCVLI
ncbi:hypothetical protein EOD08_03190, partial [Mesorhizobium sp. M6A.T.Ca.TU.002.02.2.1]